MSQEPKHAGSEDSKAEDFLARLSEHVAAPDAPAVLTYDDGYAFGNEDGRREALDARVQCECGEPLVIGAACVPCAVRDESERCAAILRAAAENAHVSTAQLLLKLARELVA